MVLIVVRVPESHLHSLKMDFTVKILMNAPPTSRTNASISVSIQLVTIDVTVTRGMPWLLSAIVQLVDKVPTVVQATQNVLDVQNILSLMALLRLMSLNARAYQAFKAMRQLEKTAKEFYNAKDRNSVLAFYDQEFR